MQSLVSITRWSGISVYTAYIMTYILLYLYVREEKNLEYCSLFDCWMGRGYFNIWPMVSLSVAESLSDQLIFVGLFVRRRFRILLCETANDVCRRTKCVAVIVSTVIEGPVVWCRQTTRTPSSVIYNTYYICIYGYSSVKDTRLLIILHRGEFDSTAIGRAVNWVNMWRQCRKNE